ncbi:NUDIX domain-containing protein [Falsibacillus pallidus]|uniref:8-oxo-dGTP diphosphatase n=1 Tax=Falsibacillus pallidus TaxID=493781 RepID=A0A370G3P4_9BACI|nr:NUDIX hydrolase [Falsibacillus pallidus]RDI37224.1 8-oxo-dGTP diphosphatase [Falsibacillus pallidus]
MNISKNNGFEFLDFIKISEEEMSIYKPIAGSFAVINCTGRYLMCYNSWRKQWELPAGQREAHETSKECAIRELYEETGQIVHDLDFKGLIKVKNLSNGNVKYNPIYFSSIDELQPFQENNETSEIKLWDLKEKIGVLDEVDIKVFDYVR